MSEQPHASNTGHAVTTDETQKKTIIKKCITRWIELNNELKSINMQQRTFNKEIREKKHEIQQQQDRIKTPILGLMSDKDIDAISVGDGFNLKSSQVSKTTGLNKQYIKDRIVEYSDQGFFVKKTIQSFLVTNHITGIDSDKIDVFAKAYNPIQCEELCDYIIDVTARKVYHDEEKLTLCQKKGRKKK
jgi:hypothetical protein